MSIMMDSIRLNQFLHYHIIVMIFVLILSSSVSNAYTPDLCTGSSVDTIERVVFLDSVERYFISSGQYYWFINSTSDLPNSDNAKLIPYGFTPDASLIKDTRQCRNGVYSLLLIQRRRIHDQNEEEWSTLSYDIGQWGENGTDSGSWNSPQRIVHCSIDSPVCTTTDEYFATMNFDFKKPLSAAYGVIGSNAYFIQDSSIHNVIYTHQCIGNPYNDAIAKAPVSLGSTVTAATEIDSNLLLFDNEIYSKISNNFTSSLSSPSSPSFIWTLGPNNFFERCPQLNPSLKSIIASIFFRNVKARPLTAQTLIYIIIFVLLIIAIVLAFFGVIICVIFKKKRKKKIINETGEDVSNDGSSPRHERHLLNSHNSKETTDDNKDSSQVRLPLQTSC